MSPLYISLYISPLRHTIKPKSFAYSRVHPPIPEMSQHNTTDTLAMYIATATALLVSIVSTFYLCGTRFNPWLASMAVSFAMGLALNIKTEPWERIVILLFRTATTIAVVFVCTQLGTSPILPVLAWGVFNKSWIATMTMHSTHAD